MAKNAMKASKIRLLFMAMSIMIGYINLDAQKKVGVNTNTPQATLDVNYNFEYGDTLYFENFEDGSLSPPFSIGASSWVVNSNYVYNGTLGINSGVTSPLQLNAISGYLVIPTGKVGLLSYYVNYDIDVDGEYRLAGVNSLVPGPASTNGSWELKTLVLQEGENFIEWVMFNNNSTTGAAGFMSIDDILVTYGNSSDSLLLIKNQNATALTIMSDGSTSFKVGVNTGIPSTSLDVHGKIRISDDNNPDQAGQIRWNITNGAFEGYNGISWINLGEPNSIKDFDKDTGLEVEQNFDDDTIRYILNGVEQWSMANKSLFSADSTSSTYIGKGTGYNSSGLAKRNLAIGDYALYQNIQNKDLIAIGDSSLHNNKATLGGTAGDNNIAVGNKALMSNDNGELNIGIGHAAMYSNTSGSFNTALGLRSLYSNLTGNTNIAIGYESMFSNLNGINNIALGNYALSTNINGNDNVAIGNNALKMNLSGNDNVAIGNNVLIINSTGNDNTAIGMSSMKSNTSGMRNSAFGKFSLLANSEGNDNVAIGFESLNENKNGNKNVAIGNSALSKNLSGNDNVAIGFESLNENTLGSRNVGVGLESMNLNETGDDNVAIGYKSLNMNTDGGENVAIGNSALSNNTSGNENVAIGFESLNVNTLGNKNVAVGLKSMTLNETGEDNVAIGYKSLNMNKSGYNNTALGYEAMNLNETGYQNVGVGTQTLFTNSTGQKNTALGDKSLFTNQVGEGNTALGYFAGLFSTGDFNVFIGHSAGSNETGDNKLYISNSSTSTPLIKGDFVAKELDFNGKSSYRMSNGTVTIEMLPEEFSGTGSQISMYTAGGHRTIEIDGDHSGRGRITTDDIEIRGGADLAEYFEVLNETELIPGTLVSIDPDNHGKLRISSTANDKMILGVISGANGIRSGLLMSQEETIASGDSPIAIAGRVYVIANDESGPIKPGDMLISSSQPGIAMKCNNMIDCLGAIVGKALSTRDPDTGFVLMLINLQ